MARVRAPDSTAAPLEGLDEGLVFVAARVSDDWDEVLAELTEAFHATRQAFASGEPIVYVVRNDDLLGRGGAGPAMVASGLVSAARTAAAEGRKARIPVNVLAVESDTASGTIARWCRRALERDGPTGEVIHLGGGNIGKVPV